MTQGIDFRRGSLQSILSTPTVSWTAAGEPLPYLPYVVPPELVACIERRAPGAAGDGVPVGAHRSRRARSGEHPGRAHRRAGAADRRSRRPFLAERGLQPSGSRPARGASASTPGRAPDPRRRRAHHRRPTRPGIHEHDRTRAGCHIRDGRHAGGQHRRARADVGSDRDILPRASRCRHWPVKRLIDAARGGTRGGGAAQRGYGDGTSWP